MLSTPDSVIVFIVLILVILTVMFVAMFVRNNPRGNNRSNRVGSQVGNVQSGARINTKDATIARRLDPSATDSKVDDPRGVDIGGNYNK